MLFDVGRVDGSESDGVLEGVFLAGVGVAEEGREEGGPKGGS